VGSGYFSFDEIIVFSPDGFTGGVTFSSYEVIKEVRI
jgi:hypothetical protein